MFYEDLHDLNDNDFNKDYCEHQPSVHMNPRLKHSFQEKSSSQVGGPIVGAEHLHSRHATKTLTAETPSFRLEQQKFVTPNLNHFESERLSEASSFKAKLAEHPSRSIHGEGDGHKITN